jgi:hypothetical protein
LHADPTKGVDSATATLALALIHEVGPKDVIEAMLATEMIVAHFAVMDTARRALHVEQTAEGGCGLMELCGDSAIGPHSVAMKETTEQKMIVFRT